MTPIQSSKANWPGGQNRSQRAFDTWPGFSSVSSCLRLSVIDFVLRAAARALQRTCNLSDNRHQLQRTYFSSVQTGSDAGNLVAMTGVLVGNSAADSIAQQLLSKGSQTPVQVSTPVPDNSEPRTPNNEPPSSASRLNGGSPTSSPSHAAVEAANQAAPGRQSSWGLGLGTAQQERTDWSRGFSRLFKFFLAGAAAPATRRGYDKWNDTEEDLFFAALKPTVGCLPNVVCTAASKRIRTKDYVQVCAPDTACCHAVCAATDRVLGIFTARTQCHAK